MTETPTEHFDRELEDITDRRSLVYGHPADNFAALALIQQAISNCPDLAIRAVLGMIGLKMVRLVQTPDHIDTVVDIAGYARTIAMIIERREDGKKDQDDQDDQDDGG